ncbi:MAG: hypothetical protein AAGI23_14370, partial [Bacteroidota bacterium]
LNYAIVRYIPYPLEFYQVIYKGLHYLIPKDQVGQQFFQPNQSELIAKGYLVAIRAKEAIQGIRLFTQYNPIYESEEPMKENKFNRRYQRLSDRLTNYYSSQIKLN